MISRDLSLEPLKHIRKVLVANRGEIAVRCIHACIASGVKTVAIYTEADATSLHVSLADESVALPGTNSTGYLQIPDILDICARHNVDAVIPGYGFLSENETFARKIVDAGMVFVGPSVESILEMGLKHRARDLAIAAKVPVVPGTDLLTSEADALEAANRIGFPVMLKASAGGGGMGLQVCNSEREIASAFAQVTSRGKTLFHNAGVFLEKYYASAHHIEVQVFGNGVDVVHFGERECSVQRRHQKVVEECPSPFVEAHPGLREKITQSAVAYAAVLKYKSAGTVEFLVDDITGDYFFLEMNTRIQVEHPITEMCYGVDLVALMLRQADFEKGGYSGIPSPDLLKYRGIEPHCAAIEVRVYAENPYRGFGPAPGLLQDVSWAAGEGVRIDTWVKTGQTVTPYYDPLVAKVITHASDRPKCLAKMSQVLSRSKVQGPPTNIDFLRSLITSEPFEAGNTLTNFLPKAFTYKPCAIDVITPGAFTTVQDYPARPGMGHGVPQCGPMDSVSFRIANLLVTNSPGLEALEMTLSGPELLFTANAVIAICGAPVDVTVDGTPADMWTRLFVKAGQKVKVGAIKGGGCRVYLAVKGGFPEVYAAAAVATASSSIVTKLTFSLSSPTYLGSKSTAPGLKYGGIQGRQLQPNDLILLSAESCATALETEKYSLPTECIPSYTILEVYVMHGPHDSDDIMTSEDREMLYTTKWRVGHNSNRTGIRLEGPKPKWARSNGGEGGSHPSNILDYGYPSPGGLNWTGDDPVAFTMDSPNLGGLICSTTVVSADLWRLGQLKPGDHTSMRPISYAQARELAGRVESYIEDLAKMISGATNGKPTLDLALAEGKAGPAILKRVPPEAGRPALTYRQGGDCFILLELGEQQIDILITVRIRLITSKLMEMKIPGVIVVPNVTSLLVQFDPKLISQGKLLDILSGIYSSVELTKSTKITTREFHLPAVLDHPVLQAGIAQYMATTRPTAAYLPDNVEYLRRNNGLATRREAFGRCIDTPFLIVAVGFLCGAPELLPLNPMNQLRAQKYNPSRTYTPGGAIGMGGSLFSMYPVEQPGGYMLVGRTVEGWDTYGTKPGFTADKPWMYEPFDLVYFHEVSLADYDKIHRDYFAGKFQYDVREGLFDVDAVVASMEASKQDPAYIAFKEGQRKGVEEQLALETRLYAEWKAQKEAEAAEEAIRLKELVSEELDPALQVTSPMDANVWKVLVGEGDTLKKGQVLVILEAMKMEINVCAPEALDGAVVKAVATKPGHTVAPGSMLVVGKK